MAFSSIPSASIQANKPITQGLWTLVKNNDDSFNDGTGIGNGSIKARSASQLVQKCVNFAFPSAGATVPPECTSSYSAAGAITYTDVTGGEIMTVLTSSAGLYWAPYICKTQERYTDNRGATVRGHYLSARVYPRADASGPWGMKVGWSDGTTYNGGVSNEISVFFDTTGSLIRLRVNKAASIVDISTGVTWAYDTLYRIRIEWITQTSINVYVNDTLVVPYTATASFPTATMFPGAGNLTQTAGTYGIMHISHLTTGIEF